MHTLHRKLLRDLRSLRIQSLTIAILIICGVSLLIGSWSAYRALIDARDSYYLKYAFADLFSELKRAPIEVAQKLKNTPHVSAIEPRIVLDGLVHFKEREPAVGRFISIPSGTQPSLNRLYIRQGRLPVSHREVEIVVHEGFAQANRIGLGDRLHVVIEGKQKQVKVVGTALSPEYIYSLSPFAPLPDDQHFGVIWMPMTSLEELGSMSGAFNNLGLKTPEDKLNSVKEAIDHILKPYGSRGAYAREKQLSNQFVNDEILQQKSTALITPIIFLGVASFLIQVITSRLVSMHRLQIATLKALGYTHREVSLHYLTLIFLIMLLGTLPGIALGAGLGQLYAKSYENFFRFPRIDFSLSLSASCLGGLAGILPGVFGAWSSIRSIFKLSPAEAMRPPLPLPFHSGWLEKFNLITRLKASQRMILRNLIFRPFRLIFSIIGMSAALALIIVAVSWNDIVRFLLNTQFQYIQREDASLTLLRPIRQGGLRELLRLTGVTDVEGYRMIPVRIRFKNHIKELALLGWPNQPRLRGRIDSNLKLTPPPGAGIILSRYFERSWRIKPGDVIELESLEGRMRTYRIQVNRFSDDLVGLNASTDLRTLFSIMDEEPSYNLVLLRIDPQHKRELYVRLKQLPYVTSVNFKSSLFLSFKKTMGSIIQVSMLILTGFALCIALGVIYNSVRVSFSERSGEIASLRVLGFTRQETHRVLLTESAFQTSLSLAPGCWLGWKVTNLILKGVNTEMFGFPIIIETSTYSKAILVILVAFLISALLATQMALKLSLADALKSRD